VCELPNQRLYEFNGNLKINQEYKLGFFFHQILNRIYSKEFNREIPISPDQILLRGSQLQNTKWIYGAVIYTGHETRIMMNSSTPPFKRSEVEKITNTQVTLSK
jgi:phospholipid-transporting ATPase